MSDDPYRLAGVRVPEKCPECGADLPDSHAPEKVYPREEWRNHIPSAYEDRNNYARIECSCGWDSWNDHDPKYPTWGEHIDAADRLGEALG